jgi:hypothetical protein
LAAAERARADPGVPDSGTEFLSRVSDGKASLRLRVEDAGSGQELVGDAGDAAPAHAVLLAAPPQHRQPGLHYPVPARLMRRRAEAPSRCFSLWIRWTTLARRPQPHRLRYRKRQ